MTQHPRPLFGSKASRSERQIRDLPMENRPAASLPRPLQAPGEVYHEVHESSSKGATYQRWLERERSYASLAARTGSVCETSETGTSHQLW